MILPTVLCQYDRIKCNLHKTSEQFYGGRDFGPVWVCPKCGAMVGCHKNSERYAPLGKPANTEDRRARIVAHEAFDALWPLVMYGVSPNKAIATAEARQHAYIWLAFELGMHPSQCHIGNFSAAKCKRVEKVCALYRERRRMPKHGSEKNG